MSVDSCSDQVTGVYGVENRYGIELGKSEADFCKNFVQLEGYFLRLSVIALADNLQDIVNPILPIKI